MPDHSAHFEATAGGMVLTNAILLYRTETPRGLDPHRAPRQDGHAFASIHHVEHGGEAGAKEAGKMRSEGKDYIVQDGDVMLFRFNV